jgi:hypothetical protein
MHCNCCDRELSNDEIKWNRQLGAWEMCSSCLDIALDAAFGQNREEEGDVTYLDDGVESDLDTYALVSSHVEEIW